MPLTEQEEFELLSLEREKFMSQQPQPNQQGMQPAAQPQNILGMVGNVPGAAIRSLLQGTGYAQGAMQPDQVPTFQSQVQQMGQGQSPLAQIMMAPLTVGGAVADIVTDPLALLSMIVPASQGGQAIGKQIGNVATKAKGVLKQVFKYDNALKQSQKSQVAIEQVRKTLGTAKSLAIQEVKDVPAEINFGMNKSQRIIDAIKNPIYEVEFTPEGGVKQTIGNLDKVKEAVGDLLTPKMWQEAPKKEIAQIKQFYGMLKESMKTAAKKTGKDIEPALNAYSKFMDNYRLVKHTIENAQGVAMGNKLKSAFRFSAEQTYKDAWKEVSKLSPEIKSVMNSMNKRELLTNLLKTTGLVAGAGLAGKGAIDLISK